MRNNRCGIIAAELKRRNLTAAELEQEIVSRAYHCRKHIWEYVRGVHPLPPPPPPSEHIPQRRNYRELQRRKYTGRNCFFLGFWWLVTGCTAGLPAIHSDVMDPFASGKWPHSHTFIRPYVFLGASHNDRYTIAIVFKV